MSANESRFIRPGCRQIEGTTDRIILNPPLPIHPAVAGITLDYEHAFGISFGEDNAFVILAAGLLGNCGDLGNFLRSPMSAGVLISCEGDVWTINTEPTIGSSFGLLITTAKGKCIICGEGTLRSTESEGSRRSTVVDFTFRTVYPFVTSSPKKSEVSGGASVGQGGQWKAEVKYTIQIGK